jgi:hypothetical protein
MQRAAFDETVQQNSYVGQAPDEQTLTLLIQRLLFFYSVVEDASRLVRFLTLMCAIMVKYFIAQNIQIQGCRAM